MPLYPNVKELISDPSAHFGLGGVISSHGMPSSRVSQVMATLTKQFPGGPVVGVGADGGILVGADGAILVGAGTVGDGKLPSSDCNKRPQNLASSCVRLS